MIGIGVGTRILGLDEILQRAAASGLTDEERLGVYLISLASSFGNYISASAEGLYKVALLRELHALRKHHS